MNESNDKVKCKICGECFPVLATHITRRHKMTTQEYLKKYSGAKLSSEKYKKKVSDTAKRRFQEDPTLRKRVSSRTFDFINDKKLMALLARDYKSAAVCLSNSLWKPSIILYSSIIEAILIAKHPKARDFYNALEVAYKSRDISEKEYHKIHIIRDLRNFVHLHKELSEGSEINEYWARAFADICVSIIKRFRK